MTIQENKAISQRYADECWNKRNLSIIDDFIAPDCPHHFNGPVTFKGIEAGKRAIESCAEAFPDLLIIFEDQIAEGNKIVNRAKLTGTHQGELKLQGMPADIPPTGKRIEIEFVNIVSLSDGKFAEIWDIMDTSWIQRLARG